jgi:hypothetical protein
LVALVTSAAAQTPVFFLLFVLQALFYAAGLLNLTPLGKSRLGSLFRVSWTFLVLNAAAAAGLWVFLTRRDRSIWK